MPLSARESPTAVCCRCYEKPPQHQGAWIDPRRSRNENIERGCEIVRSYAANEGHLNRELISQLEPLVERISEWKGQLVEVVEQITRSPGTLDRHFTTRSTLVMRLESVGIALSGTSLLVMGNAFEKNVGYQATCDLLEELSLGCD